MARPLGRDKTRAGKAKKSKTNRETTSPFLLSFNVVKYLFRCAVEHTNALKAWQRVSWGREQGWDVPKHRDPTKDLKARAPAPRRPRRTTCAAACSHLHGFRHFVFSAHPDPTSPSLILRVLPPAPLEQLLTRVAYAHTHAHTHTRTHKLTF